MVKTESANPAHSEPGINENSLASRSCEPCRGGMRPLTIEERVPLLAELSGWGVIDHHHLHKHYPFPNFKDALAFVNRVGEVAEQNGHHPNIQLTWGKVDISIWTHDVDGLTENDFILAAKCDAVL